MAILYLRPGYKMVFRLAVTAGRPFGRPVQARSADLLKVIPPGARLRATWGDEGVIAADPVTSYAVEIRSSLAGSGADVALVDALNNLVAAAQALDAALASGVNIAATASAWQDRLKDIEQHLPEYLLGFLAQVPVLASLVDSLSDIVNEGVHGEFDLGPVHLAVSSSTLVVQPPDGLPPIPIGPFQVGEIAVTLDSPFGGGLPAGGSIVRLPGAAGYGGTLELPLGPVQVSAAAVLALINGQPSFLAILGVTFATPIELSFGFSLDRVGGIVGVNRHADTDALRDAVRTGTAGDVLFAVRPPVSPLVLVSAADRLFPANPGRHLVGPSLRLSWLSFGEEGSLLSLDVGVVVEIPTGRVVILGVAKAAIPSLPFVLSLRLDVLGIIDPQQQLASIDASLVDSHVLGVFEIYGDAALRFCWGSTGYMVVSVGGFYPGFNPEPAHVPALRRVGLSIDTPVPVLEIRAEGYFAVTSNSVQFGGRLEIGINVVISAHGFVQVDAIVQFRPFNFAAKISAGFDVSVEGFSFASVTLDGSIAGPGPVVIHGSLSISVFLFSISWDQSFTLGSGPADNLPTPPRLIDVVAAEFAKTTNIHTESIGDPDVILKPQPGPGDVAAVPPTGTLRAAQRRAPLGLLIERADGRPLGGPHGVTVTTPGSDVMDRFSPGSYAVLTDAEALNRPPFDVLPAGRVLSLTDPAPVGGVVDDRKVWQIVISNGNRAEIDGVALDISAVAALTDAARRPAALSDTAPLITVQAERWTTVSGGPAFDSATAAHQFARYTDTFAVAGTDAAAPVSLAGV